MFSSVLGHYDILKYISMLNDYSLYKYRHCKHTQQWIVVPLPAQKLPYIVHYNIMEQCRATTKVLFSGEEAVSQCYLNNQA